MSISDKNNGPDYQYDVFISYSHADKQWVRNTLLPNLEQGGLDVHIDFRDADAGVPSIVNMERAVENSRHTLIVLTPSWLKSEWSHFESLLVGTIDPTGKKQRLIPLMLKPCSPPKRIAMLTYLDFTITDELNMAWKKLLATLKSTSMHGKKSQHEIIISTLFRYSESHKDELKIQFSELCEQLYDNPDKSEMVKAYSHLFIMKKDKWLDYKLEKISGETGYEGFVWIEPEGIRVVESEFPPKKLCPLTLGELIEGNPECASIIQREELLDLVINYLTERSQQKLNHLVLYGQPMVGKTKFLEFLSIRLSHDYVPLMITGQGLHNTDNLNDFLFDLADQLSNKFQKWLRQNGNSNGFHNPSLKQFEKEKAARAFRLLWENIQKTAKPKKPVVIFDEIERLLDNHEFTLKRLLTCISNCNYLY